MHATATAVPHGAALRVLELAGRAPSAHNAQPWAWRVRPRSLELHLDPARTAASGIDAEAAERNAVVACGAALHHLEVAAAALGWEAHVLPLPEPDHPTLLARLGLVRRPPGAEAGARLDALLQRCTDRRRFTSWPVEAAALVDLAAVAAPYGATVLPVLDAVDHARLERLVLQAVETSVRSGLDDGTHAVELWSTDGVLVLGDVDDDRAAWLRSGRGLGALWLEATRAGLSVVPLSRPVELREIRLAMRREVLGTRLQPHLLLRIGWQAIGRSGVRLTPRLPVEELLLGD